MRGGSSSITRCCVTRMSYDIVYNRQFIRVGEFVLPMILLGDSRTYNVYRGARGQTVQRRDRHWSPMVRLNGRMLISDEELIHEVDSWCNDYDTHFYYQGKFLNNKQLQNFVRLGCRRAMTFKEMAEVDVTYWKPSLRVYVYDYSDNLCHTRPVRVVKLSDDNVLSEIRDLENLLKDHPSYGCRFDFGGERPVHRKREQIVHSKYWAVYIPSKMSFLLKISRNMAYFTRDTSRAKKFVTEKGIDNFLKKNGQRIAFEGLLPEKKEVYMKK